MLAMKHLRLVLTEAVLMLALRLCPDTDSRLRLSDCVQRYILMERVSESAKGERR